jgi:hypothetical protein
MYHVRKESEVELASQDGGAIFFVVVFCVCFSFLFTYFVCSIYTYICIMYVRNQKLNWHQDGGAIFFVVFLLCLLLSVTVYL